MTQIKIDSNPVENDSLEVKISAEAAVDAISAEPVDNQENNPKQSRNDKRLEAINLIDKLSEHYPAIFPKTGTGRPIAFAIGLHKELVPIIQEWGFGAITLRSALAWYTRQLRYQRALLYSEFRVNLDGSQAESITEEQKTLAKENIGKVEAWILENKPEKAKKMAERQNQFAENRQKREEGKPKFKRKEKKGERKNPNTPSPKPAENSSDTSKAATSESLDDKVQSLLSKFNQH